MGAVGYGMQDRGTQHPIRTQEPASPRANQNTGAGLIPGQSEHRSRPHPGPIRTQERASPRANQNTGAGLTPGQSEHRSQPHPEPIRTGLAVECLIKGEYKREQCMVGNVPKRIKRQCGVTLCRGQ